MSPEDRQQVAKEIFAAKVDYALGEQDEKIFNAAFVISQYVDNDSLKKSSAPFPFKDPAFKGNKGEMPREEGALLVGLISVNDYLNTAPPTDEAKILDRIKGHFESLYLDPKKDTAQHINGLFQDTNEWLARSNDKLERKEDADKLCAALHTILTIVNHKIQPITSWTIKLAVKTATGLDLDETKKKIGTILPEIEKKSEQLRSSLAVNSEVEEQNSMETSHQEVNPTPSVGNKSLQTYFNERFSKILDSAQGSEIEKADKLQSNIHTVNQTLSILREARSQKDIIDSTIKAEKEKLKEIDATITHLNPVLKTMLRAVVPAKPVNSEETLSSEKNWKFHRPAALKKALDAVGLLTPKESTSVNKDNDLENSANPLDKPIAERRKELHKIVANLTELEQKKNELESKIDNCYTQLASENIPLDNLKTASMEELDTLIQTNEAAEQVLIEYSALSTTIHNQFNTLKGTIDNADAFIEKNNNWKVMLSNLFARIHSMFKTTTATQIDAFKKLKQEIEPHKEECSKMIEELKSEMNKITQGVNPSESIKDKLESQSALSSSNSIANFKDIRARFQGMIKAMPNVNEATLKEENQEQSQYTAVAP